ERGEAGLDVGDRLAVSFAAELPDGRGAAQRRGRGFGDAGGPWLDGVVADEAGVDVVRGQLREVLDSEHRLANGHLLCVAGLELEADARAGVVAKGVEHRRRQLLLVLVRQVESGAEAAGGGQRVAEISREA